MSASTKPYLIIFLTLLIGFGAGYLTNGYLLRQKVRHMRHLMEGGPALADQLIDHLALPDSTAEAVRPMLRHHFGSVKGLQRSFRRNMRQELQSLMQSLAPHLTEKQLKDLRQRLRPIGGRRAGPPSEVPHHNGEATN